MKLTLKFCTIERLPDEVLVTFSDGTSCPACPHPDMPHYREITARCGYGDDVWAYCLFHEFAHAWIEEHLHDRPSRVLWALAHGAMLSGKEAAYEEITAQVFQRWLHADERPIIGGVPWDRWKAEALAMIDQAQGLALLRLQHPIIASDEAEVIYSKIYGAPATAWHSA